jgi:urease accessory protein
MTEPDPGPEALLTLAQWLSPAFPTGSFACSHGLESAVAQGHVRDAASAADWIGTVLRFGAGRIDAELLVRAMTADPEELGRLGDEALALSASAERRTETAEQGAAFARTVAAITGRELAAMPLPVAVGAAAAGLGVPPQMVAALWLQSFAGALVFAAVRLVPLGQTEGQAILAGLRPAIRAVAEAAARHPGGAGNAALGADLAAMAHEVQPVRLFRT